MINRSAATASEKRRFLVVGMQRSGTTVVHQLIAGHPDVFTHSREIGPRLFTELGETHFNSNKGLFANSSTERSEATKADLVRLYFDAATAYAGHPENETIGGLKMALGLSDVAAGAVESIANNFKDLFVIIVQREDPLAACCSFAFADKSRRFQFFEGDTSPAVNISLTKNYFLNYFWNWHKINLELDKLKHLPNAITVSYEDEIETGKLFESKRVFDFLGIRETEVTWLTMKKSLPPIEKTLNNYPVFRELSDRALEAVKSGASFREIYHNLGPSPLSLAKSMALHALAHPGAILLKSFWKPLHWSLFKGQ